jgi:DNA-binding NtrC family response regulator
MEPKGTFEGKKILAVDDERDVLEVIAEQLEGAHLITASDFESAKQVIESEPLDLVILDIMGVKGFDLLDLARERQLPAVMLTAHSVTARSFQRAIDKKAVSFLPKEELSRLDELILEIFEELARGRTHWTKLAQRLGPTFKRLWGETWEQIKFPQDPNISW